MSQTELEQRKRLTYDDVADIYDRVTGGTARIKPMDSIVAWAEKRADLFETDKEGYFYAKAEVKGV